MKQPKYVVFEAFREFENGITQKYFKCPDVSWTKDRDGYWTIVSKKFHDSTEWKGEFQTENLYDRHVVIALRDIEPQEYLDSKYIEQNEMSARLNMPLRTFAHINDSSQLTALMRFGNLEGLRATATYIQLKAHGLHDRPLYGIYSDPRSDIIRPDVFGGKWIDVAPEKAHIWDDLLNWVLEKSAFRNPPCPVILDCKAEYKIWFDTSKRLFANGGDYTNWDREGCSVALERIKQFAGQFFDVDQVKSLADAVNVPDYIEDIMDDDEPW